jgi:nitrogen fixation protein FixH
MIVLLTGCGGEAATTSQQKQLDGITIVFEHPARAELLKDYNLVVAITDNAQKPVEATDVYLDMDMPAMPMADTKPIAEPQGNGRYSVRTAFTMEGDWVITVHATVDGTEYAAPFDVLVVPQQT